MIQPQTPFKFVPTCIFAMIWIAFVFIGAVSCFAQQDSLPKGFLHRSCEHCHWGEDAEGGFHLESLSDDFWDKENRDLMAKLDQSQEDGDRLLDRTTVFLGSNLGDGSSHSTKNLPVLVAGGGFKHGLHLAFDPDNPPPLCNLFVSLLQRLGIETDRFSTSTGTLTGLELA